ncbi:MAG TPA: hypothetical protein VIJ47_12590 [Acidimicrobiales bacterium]
MNDDTPPSLDPGRGPRSHHRRTVAALALAGVLVVLVAGCGRVHRDATGATTPGPATPVSTTATTAPAAPEPVTGASTADPAVDPGALNQITTELATVDGQITGTTGDLDAATAAINSQEGDPSK